MGLDVASHGKSLYQRYGFFGLLLVAVGEVSDGLEAGKIGRVSYESVKEAMSESVRKRECCTLKINGERRVEDVFRSEGAVRTLFDFEDGGAYDDIDAVPLATFAITS